MTTQRDQLRKDLRDVSAESRWLRRIAALGLAVDIGVAVVYLFARGYLRRPF